MRHTNVICTLLSRISRLGEKCGPIAVRFIREDNAQDLIEYAFLAAFVATAGMFVLLNLSSDVANAYSSWLDPTSGVPSLWDPADSVTSSGS